MTYNQYQQMHYQALYGGRGHSKTIIKNEKVKIWKLLYNGQETGYSGSWAICQAGENKLKATGRYSLGTFKKEPIK